MKSDRRGLTAGILVVVLLLCCNGCGTQRSPEATTASTVHVVLKPLRNADFGTFYGFEAHDKESGVLLARAEQVKMDGQILIVEETQYSAGGAVVYKGRLFFDGGVELVKEERIEGKKKWAIFHDWPADTQNLETVEEDAAVIP